MLRQVSHPKLNFQVCTIENFLCWDQEVTPRQGIKSVKVKKSHLLKVKDFLTSAIFGGTFHFKLRSGIPYLLLIK